MTLRFFLALAAIAAALSSDARVISYAPYTSTPAAAGVHSRTSRHFVLLEGPNEFRRQVVLYDTLEQKEPRVVYPPANASASHAALDFIALHERADGGEPLLLVGGYYHPALFSADGGATWRSVPQIHSPGLLQQSWVDHGGLNTQPLWWPVQNGNDAWPFIVKQSSGLWAIDANGNAKRLSPAERLVGRDREGNRFLIRRGSAIEIVDVWGNRKKLFDVQPNTAYDGWITPSGNAYIQLYRDEGRFLYFYRNRTAHFIAGPYDTPPPILHLPRPYVTELRFFAIPTHDFNGAWMIQRQEGRPTTLLRHIPGNDLETMWSDPTGREVEALIPGRSGETLLVQVHVPRDISIMPFVDPALAVWRVGEPMPDEYDELYLNEEANKGFLHVDVDRIEDGEMFVFNAGTVFGEVDEAPVSAPLPGAADVYQEWGVVRASLKQRLVLPGVTRTSGLNGSEWATDITIDNPLDVAQNVEIRYVAAGADPSVAAARLTRTITLPPRRIEHIRDVLNSLFLVAASGGALYFTPDIGINVFGRTYTRRADGGTYGYGLNAIDVFNAAGPRFPLTFSGAFPGPGFRTNVMLTDMSGRGAAADLGRSTMSVIAGGVTQAAVAGSAATGLTLKPTRGMLIPMVVAIDNITNDATYFPPDPAAPEGRTIPFVASTDTWRTDLYLHNASPYARAIRLIFQPWDGSEPMAARWWYVESGETRVIPDVLRRWFAYTGIAQLRYFA
ncbi:MAG TPA: hypothetical protein VHK90_07545, partial [Thermoanaerobaculia bacterium]|nr:hypothetical protein [Thermoanaerobaculia bacterium]